MAGEITQQDIADLVQSNNALYNKIDGAVATYDQSLIDIAAGASDAVSAAILEFEDVTVSAAAAALNTANWRFDINQKLKIAGVI